MTRPSRPAEEKPGWAVPVLLFGVIAAIFGRGGVWTAWALLWAPLFGAAGASVAYEWRLLRRGYRYMSALQWILLIVAHLGFVYLLTGILGFRDL
ncbi:hypothetical protein OHA84_35250 [Streptomyces sp. NBC_00513]|uniref:hypothetical protein n=1 Tax=unclassified Streptomyces TaxID=2593676 RepID=UPI0022584D6B|nr:hypothetical protein [Streptomyces sp. NBC_00424]MCX5071224.1 hypothetical protein [Streptomyces sp. NBC_00424]WUD45359.1 hypothetical protein OHA84_35250 [Streptomyces sp. NBC_00513]